jgi:hypothetical protein
MRFRNANLLASHKGDLYNSTHWLGSDAQPLLVSSTSSFGGLSPADWFGLFFPPDVRPACAMLAWSGNFPYNSRLFRKCPRKKIRESLRRASMRNPQAGPNKGRASQLDRS